MPKLLNAWLAPDGTMYPCPAYGHVFTAKDIHDERPEVQQTYLDILCDFNPGFPDNGENSSILTAALEKLGYLKLATRSGKTDWYWHHMLTHITPQQSDALLALSAKQREPFPKWVDRETRRIL